MLGSPSSSSEPSDLSHIKPEEGQQQLADRAGQDEQRAQFQGLYPESRTESAIGWLISLISYIFIAVKT